MKKTKGKELVKVDNSIQKILEELGVVRLIDTDTHINRMEIRSETSDRLYVVSQRMKKDGTIQNECGCPAWIFRRHCKHLDVMGPVLEQIAAAAKPMRQVGKKEKKKIEHVPETKISVAKKAKVKGPTPDDKDFQRIESIIEKSGGDTDKMLSMCERMAKSITHPDKAQRRAVAAKQTLPKSIATKAYNIFWQD